MNKNKKTNSYKSDCCVNFVLKNGKVVCKNCGKEIGGQDKPVNKKTLNRWR